MLVPDSLLQFSSQQDLEFIMLRTLIFIYCVRQSLPSVVRSRIKAHRSSQVTTGTASLPHARQHIEKARSQFLETGFSSVPAAKNFGRIRPPFSPKLLTALSSPLMDPAQTGGSVSLASQLAQSAQPAVWSTD
ncbi:hypothetical protein MJO29_012988 [Puccinia striiformis f. sp. tritici]|nr:hypothetical protein Pst134EB_025127 [Puccinia striiformis f. sp. tritici]KAI7943144.1 hypothetical protein MJO29_012988 [Puccinia striiformis f. sp. tritici]